jgi:hypothetical protein
MLAQPMEDQRLAQATGGDRLNQVIFGGAAPATANASATNGGSAVAQATGRLPLVVL